MDKRIPLINKKIKDQIDCKKRKNLIYCRTLKREALIRAKKITNIIKYLVKLLAKSIDCMYNNYCWSLTAMKREVAGTPGRIAMASVREISVENV
ncbi:hypothetical protein CW357_03830 [Rummeliibacillus sp. TYF005]|nr:hypothetical protein CW357_03830 [Rummeliibacillus sp. TYF005]